jgi:hypothetical protein
MRTTQRQEGIDMPTLVVDANATFATMLLMSAAPKEKFQQPGVQDVAVDGTPKWAAQLAVTYHAENGMTPQSEVLNVSVTSHANPVDGIAPGTPVMPENLRAGLNPPEKRDNGSIRGGRWWFSATGLRSSLMAGARKGD